jgi:hypothetical protein
MDITEKFEILAARFPASAEGFLENARDLLGLEYGPAVFAEAHAQFAAAVDAEEVTR